MMTLDVAKQIYREAWEEYRFCFDEEDKVRLEKIMDNAQNSFPPIDKSTEWFEFIETLPGYTDYWKFIRNKSEGKIPKHIEND